MRQTASMTRSNAADEPRRTRVRVVAPRRAGVVGRVLGSDGKPVPGALVLLMTVDPARGGMAVTHSHFETPRSGKFAFEFDDPRAEFGITVIPRFEQPFRVVDEFPVGVGGATLEVVMEPGVGLRGRVSEPSGPAECEYELSLVPDTSCPAASAHAVLLQPGFELPGLAPGTYQVELLRRCRAGRRWSRWRRVQVAPRSLTLVRASRTVVFRVIDDEGS